MWAFSAKFERPNNKNTSAKSDFLMALKASERARRESSLFAGRPFHN
jgi:hypothetical protein